MPNTIAYAALFAAPVIAFLLFQRYNPIVASALTLILGYLFLPEDTEIDLPILPAYDKDTASIGAVIVFATLAISKWKTASLRQSRGLYQGEKVGTLHILPGWLPKHPVPKFLFLALIPAALITAFTNQESVVLGSGVRLRGYDLYSVAAYVMSTVIGILPILIGRRMFGHPEGQKTLLAVLAMTALAYSALVLVEIRLSPQLHRWVYGFHPFSFVQAVRGGYRPSVFTSHGLWLAIFNVMAVLAAIGAYKAAIKPLKPSLWLAIGLWMAAIVVLSNSLGALGLLLMFLPLAIFAPMRVQLLTAAVIGMIILTYPVLRERGIVPVDAFVSVAESVDADRARSLAFRIENEDAFLERVREKPLAGWGRFGRNFVYDEFTGERTTVVDGYWVIVFSVGGYLSYLLQYGLLTFAFFQILFRSKGLSVGPETAALSLILAANLIDMILNGTATVITWIVAGAMIGRVEVARERSSEEEEEDVGPIRGGRMRHRTMRGVKSSYARNSDLMDQGSTRLKEHGPRTDAATRLDSDVPNQRGDQYTRYRKAHSRALKDDASPKPRQNFRKR